MCSYAKSIKAPVIVEVANGPISHDADSYLAEQKRTIIPDILANAGGVVVSYFEWVQNRSGYYWSLEEVHNKLETIMLREFDTVYRLSQQHDVDMRTAAYIHALNRFAEAITAQGTHSYFQGKV